MEQLFKSYFEEAKDLSKIETLVSIARSVDGLSEDSVRSMLESDQFAAEVLQADQRSKRGLRVSGVPYFVIEDNNGGRPVAFSGAQVDPSWPDHILTFLLSLSPLCLSPPV
jgi:predicted DsbA family dithiol-disulfide isomerase